jgi:ring-1,2-phenylacetyl-CoA epoxidase subunit PaaE
MYNSITKFIEAYIGQFVWFAIWTLPAFFILWIIFKKFFANRRIQETQKADKTQLLRELKNSLLTIIVFTGIDVFVFHDSMKTMETATFKVYSSFTEHGGIPYFIFITFLLFVVEDTYFYWMHKTVHSPKLYKYIHKVHHESIDTTPFTSYSFHPIEAALEIVPMGLIMVIAYFFPVHILALVIWQFLSIALNVLGHSGYELFPSFWNNYWFLKWKLPATHHNMHHERFNGNYGLYFIWWDRIMGTEFPDYEEKFKSIFQRKSNSIDELVYHDLKISAIVNETQDTYSIYFEQFPYVFKNYKAGQHVNLKVVVKGKALYRTFSLSSSPTKDKFLRLTIKKAHNGLVTNYLTNYLRPNDTLAVSAPKGNFFIEQNPANARKILLFAGGSGITPLFSMINTLLKDEPNSNIKLFYTNKNIANSIFLNELKEIQKSNKNHFELLSHFSEEDGQATKNQIAEIVINTTADEYFICGPTGFMDLVKNTLASLNINQSKIKSEQFINTVVNKVASDAKIVSNVKAIINQKEHHFNILENELLLDAAIRQNINIPFSCRSGMCGTCIANCSKGSVVMDDKQTFLSEEAIDKSKILLCQSKAISENITIEINS